MRNRSFLFCAMMGAALLTSTNVGLAAPVHAGSGDAASFAAKSMQQQALSNQTFTSGKGAFAIVAPSEKATIHQFDMFDAPDELGVNTSEMGISPIVSAIVKPKPGNPGGLSRLHNMDITTDTPSVQTAEDMPNFHFSSCIRIQVDNGAWVEDAIATCKQLNPQVLLNADKVRMQQELDAIPDPTSGSFSFHKGHVTHDGVDEDTSAAASTTPQVNLPEPTPQILPDAGDNKVPVGCDVSYDFKAMFSARCLQGENNMMMERMDAIRQNRDVSQAPLTNPEGLKLPSSLTQTPSDDSISGGQHSFFVKPKSSGRNPAFDESVLDEELPRQQNIRPRAESHSSDSEGEEMGHIRCDWSVGAVGEGVENGQKMVNSVKACIRVALAANYSRDGISSISITQNGFTQSVECHRHHGHDICAVTR